MKLAEALSMRADLQARIEQLKRRLKDSSKVQEGDEPAEDVNTLYKELNDCLAQLEDIIYRINRTNMQTEHEGEPLTWIIARKDALKLRLNVMRDVLKHIPVFVVALISLALAVVLYYIIQQCGGMSEERWMRIF